MRFLFVTAILFLCLFSNLTIGKRRGYVSEGIRYALRISNVSMCYAPQRKVYVSDIVINTLKDYQQYVDCKVNVTTDLNIKKVRINIFRCINDGYTCENFQTWSFTDICPVALMKNQIWSPVIQSTYPKFTCPLIKKNIYRNINATINLEKVVQLYPEVAKYHWKGECQTFDIHGDMIHCTFAKGYMLSYTKRVAINETSKT